MKEGPEKAVWRGETAFPTWDAHTPMAMRTATAMDWALPLCLAVLSTTTQPRSNSVRAGCCHPYFTDEATKAQGGERTCRGCS